MVKADYSSKQRCNFSVIDLRSKKKYAIIICEQQEIEIESLNTCVYACV